MTIDQLVNSVKAFANKPDDVIADRGTITAEVRDDLFEVHVKSRQGNLYCVENGQEFKAWEWLTKRLGRFEQLARRIQEYVPEDKASVPIRAKVSDVIDNLSGQEEESTDNAQHSVRELLDSDLAGTTKVVYLTADAGEGKTNLIEQLSRKQAGRYLAGQADWLMLPVSLGGRPFIRLDDVIVGTLSNRFRFLYYYYDSVVELIRQNALVLALDGFEEMFIETGARDAVSSLGKLVSQLNSRGKILIAARSAFYKYRNFEAHAKLFDSMKDADAAFAEVALERWSRDQFVALAEAFGIKEEGIELYKRLSQRLEAGHPLLTRAVLARRLIEEYERSENRQGLIDELSQAKGEDFFDQFVTRIVQREAREKWIDQTALEDSKDAARPLLTVEQHHRLLASVAEEMWHNGVDALQGSYLEEIAEIVVHDDFQLPPGVARQARDKITSHALLVKQEGMQQYQFDHEHFKNYYIGRHLAKMISSGTDSRLRSSLEISPLPDLAVRVCVSRFTKSGILDPGETLDRLCKMAEAGRSASYLKANVAKIGLRLMESGAPTEKATTVSHFYVSGEDMKSYRVQNVIFEDCVFERLYLKPSHHTNLSFLNCTVVQLIVVKATASSYECISFDKDSLPNKMTVVEALDGQSPDEDYHFSPDSISFILRRFGMKVDGSEDVRFEEEQVQKEPDIEVQIVDRVLRYFQRSTSINEHTFAKRLGDWYPTFEDQVLPELLDMGVLREVTYSGGGNQKRFRLSVDFRTVEQARKSSKGSYERLKEALKSSKSA